MNQTHFIMYCKNFLLVLALLLTPKLLAQDATVFGTIELEDIGALSDIHVIVVDADIGTISDSMGKYELILPAGEYSLIFSYTSYDAEKRQIKLLPGEKREINIDLFFAVTSIEDVIVKSGGKSVSVPKSPTPIDVIKASLFEETADVSPVATLRKLPGVQVVDGQTYFRGGNGFSYGAGSRVSYLVDGLSILTADNGAVNYDFIPQENIGALEVIKGASSCLYGSGALNGIVNFRTASPTRTSKSKAVVYSGLYFKPRGMSETWWQSDEESNPYQLGAYFTDSRIIKDKIDLVSGIYFYKTKSYRNPEESEWFRVHSNFRYRFSENLHAGVNFNFQDKKSVSFFIWDGLGESKIESWEAITNPINDIWRIIVDPFITYRSPGNWKHRVKTRFHRALNTNQTKQSFASEIYYGEYRLQKMLLDSTLTISTGASVQSANVEGNLYAMPSAAATDTFNATTSNTAIFLQLDKSFGDKINLTAGARWESNSMTGVATESKPVFRFGFNYELISNSTYLQISMGQGYRFPTVAERYICTDLSLLKVLGNLHLKSETGYSSELGLHQNFRLGEKWLGFAKASVFYSRYNDMMEFVFGGEDRLFAGFQTINTGDTQIAGTELTVAGEGKIGKIRTSILGGYTYLDPTYVDWDPVKEEESTADYNVLKYRFRHNAKIDMQAGYRGWSLGGALQYYSKVEAIDAIFGSFVPDLDEYQTMEADDAFVLDLRMSRKIGGKGLLSINCNNVLNRSYTLRPAIMESPRYIQTKFSWNL